MNKIIRTLLVGGILSLALVPLSSPAAGAVNAFDNCTGANKDTTVCKAGNSEKNANNMVTDLTNLLLYILGTIAVISIIIGGIRYATSDGDSAKLKSARDTILYAVVGLIVAILAWSIVNFVIKRF